MYNEAKTRMAIVSLISAIAIMLVIAPFIAAYHDSVEVNQYEREAVVTEIVDNIQFYVDNTGNEWSTIDEDVQVGDNVILVMDTQGTANVYDDAIVNVRVCK